MILADLVAFEDDGTGEASRIQHCSVIVKERILHVIKTCNIRVLLLVGKLLNTEAKIQSCEIGVNDSDVWQLLDLKWVALLELFCQLNDSSRRSKSPLKCWQTLIHNKPFVES